MERLSPVAADDSSGANPSSVKSDDSSPRQESGRGSPPPNCAICLGTCRNKSFTDSCLHQFCFKCLLTWSKVKAECPLCKQNFKSIIHNVRSNHQYEEYMVEQRETEEPIAMLDLERLDLDNPIVQATRRFRYRTTMTLPRRDSLAIQQLLLQYPMAGLVPASALPARRRRSPASFRRTVYRHRLWARPLPDFTGRFRDCSPHFYRYNDTQMHRLVPWLNRELHYLLNENIGHISYVITRILELLPQYHINSPEFREAVRPYFRDRTEHFLHELYCFASTPYDMTGYDRNVQYTTDTRISTMINEVISSSESEASADSDIVMVTGSEPAEQPAGPSRGAGPSRVPQPVYPQNYISQPAASDGVIPIETISQSDTDDDDSEVLVVGYIKPPQDRTPEVVDLLGSDSDVIVQDTVPAERAAGGEPRPANRVKLVLKRHVSDRSDSEDSEYRPPARRRRRPRSPGGANNSAHSSYSGHSGHSAAEGSGAADESVDRSAEEPASAPPLAAAESPPAPVRTPAASATSFTNSPSASSSTISSSASSSTTTFSSPSTTSTPTSDTFSDSSSASSPSGGRRTKISKRKYKRKNRKINDATGKNRKKSSSKKLPSRPRKKDKISKRKPRSGRGTKSSKKKGSVDAPSERSPTPLDQPSTSGVSSTSNSYNNSSSRERKRRQSSRESRRLKSVVNVMYNNRKVEESGSSVTSNLMNSTVTNSSPTTSSTTPDSGIPVLGPTAVAVETRDYEDSDWDDDLPLNLTVQKTFHSL